MFWVLGTGWYRRETDSVKNEILENDFTTAQADLDKLIASRQAYIDNLPTQAEKDAMAESQSELKHSRQHLDLARLGRDIPTQKGRAQRILDGIQVI